MVTWVRASFPGGPIAMRTLVAPGLGLQIVTKMMFDARENRTFHFRPDNLCEPALLARFCRHKQIRDWIAGIAKEALIKRNARFQGKPGPELLSLMMQIASGEGPEAISTPSSETYRLALCRIVRETAAHLRIPKSRKPKTVGRRSACDVVAEAWPDQIESANSAIRTWNNTKKKWWLNVTDVEVTETHVNTQVAITPWSAPARNRLGADQTLQLTVKLPKTEADYSCDFWMWGKTWKSARTIVMQGIEELVTYPASTPKGQIGY